MANAEMDMKANLTDLSKIPVKEFEKHFRDWMERDDVARALQAKLRTDLISNFNKTALGRQILAQTTTTTTGGSTHRLTLSPLVLALNTLVAEFLYAQNCHFTLSVFCTEVPFRNTLPDFENSQHFRFTGDEIKEILEAIFEKTSYEASFKNSIIRKYEGAKNVSLLMLILRYLLRQKEECVKKIASIKSGVVTEGTQTTEVMSKPCATDGPFTQTDSFETRRAKIEISNSNMRYLNKYLMILSTKVKEMSEQFEELRKKRYTTLPSTRLTKSVRTRRYEKLNRSLERIMDQLKHMTHTKRKSKQVMAVVSSVDALAAQFTKCVESFRTVSKDLIASSEKHKQLQSTVPHKPINSQVAVQVDLFSERAQGGEQKQPTDEKTYTDWVHEMRHTKNGQKFLDRIEASLKKALNRQRELLRNESEEKLQHQKELLKIQYKEKLMEHVSRLPAYDCSTEARKLNETIGQQLQEFETRHAVLLQKIQEANSFGATECIPVGNATSEMTEEIVRRVVKEMEPKTNPVAPICSDRRKEHSAQAARTRDPLIKDVVNTQKQLQKMVKSITQQERNVDQIVHDARMRIQELENESNQLELNFRNYLERQRLQAETMREVVSSLSENNQKEKECLKVSANYRANLKNIRESSALRTETDRRSMKGRSRNKALKPKDSLVDFTDQENKSPNLEYRNAILDAKAKLFQSDCTAPCAISEKAGCDDVERSMAGVEQFYYNRNFGKFDSQSNLLSKNAYTGQLNQKPSSLVVNTSKLTLTSLSTLPLTLTDITFSIDTNTLSAKSNGAPLEKSYTMLPNTPQIIMRKSALHSEQRSLTTIRDAEEAINTKPLSPLSDAAVATVIAQTATASTVAGAAAANGEWDINDMRRFRETLTKQSESDTSTSNNDDGILVNQSISDLSKNSSDSIGRAVGRRTHSNSSLQRSNERLLVSGEKDTGAFSGKPSSTTNPVTTSTKLVETMERMHRIFTETTTNATEENHPQTQVQMQQKQELKQRREVNNQHQHRNHLKSTLKTQDTRKNIRPLSDEPSTSAEANAKAAGNRKSRTEKKPQTSQCMEQSTNQPLNTFTPTEITADDDTAKTTGDGTEPQCYNITVGNAVNNNEALAPTISSTTFSICLEDNLKEVVSVSSIEIASMVEAVDEEIELDELVSDVDDEEEEEEEQEEEEEPMGGVKISTDPILAIEKVSGVSTSSSSALSMSHGGGINTRMHSDSGSDFWR
ncbi:putative leucine-rich repeat-containing protein DDB_G0290503 [Rhagoletis pomonella]|uniref:putative leucine-rich repeat-containing protein DDB_G0290503 n=1 Tax=Rhagoletis pomonella TaxID=28610 RepID=UPI00177B8458|nr:putative leucine-rich repeat-containing protein DDB_G0290503 [Rhagoletis pomonella]